MTMVKVCSFAPGQNLDLLRQQLDTRGLAFELRDNGGVVELWVEDAALNQVAGVLDQLRRPDRPRGTSRVSVLMRAWPLTLVTLALGICGYLLVSLQPEWAGFFTFTELKLFISYEVFHSFTQTYWIDHQWWRLISPAFLHFGIWHVLFNGLALWELGRRLEFVLPAHWYALILLITGVAANFAQYLLASDAIFGGLSGVIFGLFGAIALLHKRSGFQVLQLPPGLYVLAAVSLVVLPFVLKVFDVHVANGAHVGGLMAGLMLGLLIPLEALRSVPASSNSIP
jgi:GlpG protein